MDAEFDRVMGLRARSAAERDRNGGVLSEPERDLVLGLLPAPSLRCSSLDFLPVAPSDPSSVTALSPVSSFIVFAGEAVGGIYVPRERFTPPSIGTTTACSALLLRRVRMMERYVGFLEEGRKEKVGELGVDVGD